LAARSGETSYSFFPDYQGQRFDHPTTSKNMTVFTNNERNGDFRHLSTQLKNPVTGVPYQGKPDSNESDRPGCRRPLCLRFYPKPINDNTTNNAVYQQTQAFDTDQGDADTSGFGSRGPRANCGQQQVC
jgi:hypothetical protein